MSIQIGALFGQIVLEDNFTNVLNNVQSSVVHAGRTLNAFGSAAMGAGTALSIGITAPLVAAAGASLNFAVEFDKNMTRVVNLSGVSEEQMHKFRDSILELAPAVGVGPNALSEGLLKITSTGFRGAEAMDILKIAAKGSAVGLGDVAVVGGAVTAIISAYGRENIDAARAAEILFNTVVEGRGEADELADVLGRVVGVTANVGVELEEVGAFLASFTRVGVDTSEAVTALRGAMMSILDPSEQANQALELAGTSAAELRDSIRRDGLTAAMTELILSLKDTDGATQKVFGNVRAMTGVLTNFGLRAEETAGILKKLKEDTDNLGVAFTRAGETPAFTMEVLKAKLEKLAIVTGNILIPAFVTFMDAMKPLIDVATSLVGWFGKLGETTQLQVLSTFALAAAAGPLLFVFGSLATGVGSLVKLYGMFQVGTVALTAATTASTVASTTAATVYGGTAAGLITNTQAAILNTGGYVGLTVATESNAAATMAGGVAHRTAAAALVTSGTAAGGLTTAMGLLSMAILPVTVAVGGLIYLWKSGNFEEMADEIEYLSLVMSGHSQESARAAVTAHRLTDAAIEQEKAIQAQVDAMKAGSEAVKRFGEDQEKAVPPVIDAAVRLRQLHDAALKMSEEALKPLSSATKDMIHDFTIAGHSASEIADFMDLSAGAVTRVVEAERLRLKGLKDHQDALDDVAASQIALTSTQEDSITALDLLGHSASKIAEALELSSAAVTRFLEEEKKLGEETERIAELSKKSMEETSELYRDLALLKVERSGTTTEVQLAHIERWRQNEIAKLDASDLNWQAHYDAIMATSAFAAESQLVDFEKLNEGSKAQMKSEMDLAKNTYEYAIHHARLYSTEKIALLLAEKLATEAAYFGFGQVAVAAGQTAAQAMEWVGNGIENAGQNFEYFQRVATNALKAVQQAAQDAEDHVWRLSHSITFALEELSAFEFERLGGEARLREIEAGYRLNPGRKSGGTGTTGNLTDADHRAMLEEQRIYQQLLNYLQRHERDNASNTRGGGAPSGWEGTAPSGTTPRSRPPGISDPHQHDNSAQQLPAEDRALWDEWISYWESQGYTGYTGFPESFLEYKERMQRGGRSSGSPSSGRSPRSSRSASGVGGGIVIESGAVVINAITADTRLVDKAAELLSEAIMRRQLALGNRLG